MSFDWRLLEILADGEFHSGEELGGSLDVSRAAIWKQLQKIEESLGVKFESIKGRGYRLIDGLELLSEEEIAKGLPESGFSLNIVRQIDSTNRLAAELAGERPARGLVVLAELQSAGRGRRGRQWVSPFGKNIYCSIVWVFDSGIAALEGLSLAVGVGVVRALRKSGIHGTGLKWPNDVLHEGRKLAGILLEMAGDVSGQCQVVIGIGINVVGMSSADAEGIGQPWTDANSVAGRCVSRNTLAAHLIAELLVLLRGFESRGFSQFYDEWAELDCTNGNRVTMHIGEQQIHGTAAGVDASGAFRMETDVGVQLFHGGEVSLRVDHS